jgi:high-affinity iron transporter
MTLNSLSVVALLVASAMCRPQAGEPRDRPAATARRLAGTLSIALDEYARGVSHGRVTSADEFREARLLLQNAGKTAAQLPASLQAELMATLTRLREAAAALRDPAELRLGVDSVRTALAQGLGIALDPMPRRAPSLADGARVYAARCATCHGADGSGHGPAGAALVPAPPDFTDRPRLMRTSPLDFFRKISAGVAGTAMPAFEGRLTMDERWAVALYVSGLRYTPAERVAGQRLVERACDDCLLILADLEAVVQTSDDSLMTILRPLVGEQSLFLAVAFARTAAASDQLGEDRVLAVRVGANAVDSLVRQVAELALAGRWDEADARVVDAYLAFERVERDIGARSGRSAHAVEIAFAGLRTAVASRSPGAVDRAVTRARAAIGLSATAVSRGGSTALAFGQSLLIILREGIEAILIIGALIALLHKAGVHERIPQVGAGAAVAVVASLVTAGLFATLVRVSAAGQEALEGVTLLLASAVLLSAASWLVAKIEAERWMAFVSARMQGALRSGRTLALAGVAFLAVYREGVETVLFYGALFGTTDSAAGHLAVAAGLAVGAGMLAVVYVAIQRYGLRIPLKPFFAATGMLLTVMAVSFAGQGVAELQAAGWVPATRLNLPALPALGVFPTVQTLAAQVVVAGAFLAGVAWIFWLSPRLALGRRGS